MNNRIVVIAPNDGTDVRVSKICRSLSKMKIDLYYIGWDRRLENKKNIDLGTARLNILKLNTKNGRATFATLFVFFKHILTSLKKIKPRVVYCVNEEYSLMALPARNIYYKYLICDVFDGLNDRLSHKNLMIDFLSRTVGYFCRTMVDYLVCTDNERFERFGKFKSKTIVICNYPEDPGDEYAKNNIGGPLKIYVGGTLSLGRGLKQLLIVLDLVRDIEVISAGWLYDEFARKEFVGHQKVKYNGVVSAKKSLDFASKCDAIFAFYDPNIKNNRFASPNKVYDAMCIGRPVIINEEAYISQWVIDNDLGFGVPYSDVNNLKNVIISLKNRRKNINIFSDHARIVFKNGYSWDMMENRIFRLFESLK